MRILQAADYHVTRAAGSLGMFDIVAINAQGVRLIQVKTYRDASPLEREAIQLFDGLPTNATKDLDLPRLCADAHHQADWVGKK
jgi:hypothetical protein